jgi:hypothetical protein
MIVNIYQTVNPFWKKGSLVRLPRELILWIEGGVLAPSTRNLDTFVEVYGERLTKGGVYINDQQYRHQGGRLWGNPALGGGNYLHPSLVDFMPSQDFTTCFVDDYVSPGNYNIGVTKPGRLVGGERLMITFVETVGVACASMGYTATQITGPTTSPTVSFTQRADLITAHADRCHTVDNLFTKVQRIWVLWRATGGVPGGYHYSDISAIVDATESDLVTAADLDGNNTLLINTELMDPPDAESIYSLAEIWGSVQSFFGL